MFEIPSSYSFPLRSILLVSHSTSPVLMSKPVNLLPICRMNPLAKLKYFLKFFMLSLVLVSQTVSPVAMSKLIMPDFVETMNCLSFQIRSSPSSV